MLGLCFVKGDISKNTKFLAIFRELASFVNFFLSYKRVERVSFYFFTFDDCADDSDSYSGFMGVIVQPGTDTPCLQSADT